MFLSYKILLQLLTAISAVVTDPRSTFQLHRHKCVHANLEQNDFPNLLSTLEVWAQQLCQLKVKKHLLWGFFIIVTDELRLISWCLVSILIFDTGNSFQALSGKTICTLYLVGVFIKSKQLWILQFWVVLQCMTCSCPKCSICNLSFYHYFRSKMASPIWALVQKIYDSHHTFAQLSTDAKKF